MILFGMNKKLITIIFLFFIFFVFLYFLNKAKECPCYKILKVVEADWLYIDFNKNNMIDGDELVKIKNINAFSPLQNDYAKEKSIKLGITTLEYLKAGFLARSWAKDNLEGSFVCVKSKARNLKYNAYLAELSFNDLDLGEFLLKNGLAYVNSNCDNILYLPIQNINEIRNNAKEVSRLDFLLLNLRSGVIHKTDCEYAKVMHNGELLLKKSIKNVYHYCRICFGDNYSGNITYDIPKSKHIYKKLVYKNFGYFEIYLINPLEYKKPNLGCNNAFAKRIIKEIDSCNKTIDLALYSIGEQKEIVDALRRAKARGVKIRSVVDYSKNISEIYPETVKFADEFDSRFDKTEILMHNKIFIFDDKRVLVGSTNISSTDSGGYNANISIIFNSAQIASYYKTEINQMLEGKFSKRKTEFSPLNVELGNFKIRIFLLPKSNANSDYIIPAIQNSNNEILVSAFYLTDKNIISELILARKRGVKVYILLDALGASNFKNRILQLRNNNIPTKIENWGGKNHEKTILIDNKILITGSSNFSVNGLYKNDENITVIENCEVASFYRDYYFYLFNSIDNKYLRAFPRAEGWDSINSCYDGVDNNHDGKIDLEDEGCKIYKNFHNVK